MRTSILGLLLLISATIFGAERVFNITGRVVDQSGIGLAYVSVELLDAEGKVIDGILSDGDGNFTLGTDLSGDYTLQITVAGARPHQQVVSLTGENTDLGTIVYSGEVTALDDVVVRGETSMITTQIDRRIVEVGRDLVSAGATASEVLNNIPSLNVDQQSGALSLRGNTNVRVFVDGKPSSVPIADLLRQIPSNSIQRVEIITNPSAKYDPDGNSGIVNIVLVKEKRLGYNVNTNLGFTKGNGERYNGSVGGNYNTGNLNLFGNYNHDQGISHMRARMNNETLGLYNLTAMRSASRNHLVKVGFDWFIDDRNALTIYTNQGMRDQMFITPSYLTFNNGNTIVDNSDYDMNMRNQDYSFNYKHTFLKPGHELEVDGIWSIFQTDLYAGFDWLSAVMGVQDEALGTELRYYGQNQDVRNNNRRLRADYTLPVWEKGKFEIGTQYLGDNRTETFLTTQRLPVYGPAGNITDALEAHDIDFSFIRDIYAGYVNLGYQWEKFGMQLGMRIENQVEKLDVLLTGSSDIPSESANIDRNDVYFYPSAFFTYKLTESDQLSLNYSRRVDRPGPWSMSPVRNWQTATARQEGNPNLRPQFTDSYEIGYLKTFGRTGNINASIFYRNVNDFMTQLISVDELNPNIVIMRTENLDNRYAWGAETSWYLRLRDWWSTNGGLNYYVNEMKSVLPDGNFREVVQNQFVARMSNDFTLAKNTRLQLFTMYNGGQQTLQGETLSMFRQDIGIRQNFAGGKGTITARLSDIFNTFYARSANVIPYVQTGSFRWESRTLYVGLQYNFGGKVRTRADKQRNQGEQGGGIGF
ncbi:MAG: TonB-dependent receptor [Weeksellaceae bacterium]|nr:TonB-dependent receptor [Weeksellaceae bacterium]